MKLHAWIPVTLAAGLLVPRPVGAEPDSKGVSKTMETDPHYIPDSIKTIQEKCGITVKYNVDWNSFRTMSSLDTMTLDMALDNSASALGEVCSTSLDKNESLAQVGKDAVKKTVKAIKIVNVADAKLVKVSFQGGVLELDYNFQESRNGMTPGGEADVVYALEDGLQLYWAYFQRNLETKYIPDDVKAIEKACGVTVKLDADWGSMKTWVPLPNHLSDMSRTDTVSHAFDFAVMGLSDVCTNSHKQDAVKKKVQQVRVVNVTSNKDVKVTLANGVLQITSNFADNNNPSVGWTGVRDYLQKQL